MRSFVSELSGIPLEMKEFLFCAPGPTAPGPYVDRRTIENVAKGKKMWK